VEFIAIRLFNKKIKIKGIKIYHGATFEADPSIHATPSKGMPDLIGN
jgi:hypothetical protein